MTTKTLGIAGAVTLALVALSFWDFKSQQNKEQQKSETQKIVSWTLPQLTGLEGGANSKQAHWRLQKRQEQWWLTHPVEELADQARVQEFLTMVFQQSYEKSMGASGSQSPLDWGHFQLAELDTLSYLQFDLKEGEPHKIWRSPLKNFEGKVYLKVHPPGSQVYLASGPWDMLLEKKALDFRDKRLFRGTSEWQSWRLKSKTQDFDLRQEQNIWKSPAHKFRIDQNKMRELLYVLSNASIVDFYREKWEPKTVRPELHLSLVHKDQTSVDYFFYKEGAEFLVGAPSLNKVLRISQQDYRKFSELDWRVLRDRHEPFAWAGSVTSVKVKAPDQDWQAQIGSQAPNAKLAQSLVDQLQVLNVEEFEVSTKITNDFKASHELRFQVGENEVVFLFGQRQVVKVGPMEKKLIPVKSSLFESLVFILESDFNKLEWGAKVASP